MITKMLLKEFNQEAENTRKLLNAIPDSALDYKPSETNWTTAQLAAHIANIYYWYQGVFNSSEYDIGKEKYEQGDISKISSITAKFEENVKAAQAMVEKAKDEEMLEDWKMVMNGKVLMPPAPRIEVIRGFLMNHMYHHRGEMIIYLRSTGNKVPGLYGPVYEDSKRQS